MKNSETPDTFHKDSVFFGFFSGRKEVSALLHVLNPEGLMVVIISNM